MDYEKAYRERTKQIAAERASWPETYAVVRELTALGFVAGAFGRVADDPPFLCPPTKFGYTAGGLRHPHDAGGPGEGATFHVWAFNRDEISPDDLRAQPVWIAGDPDALSLTCYRTRWRLTLDAAVALCLAMAEHHREDFIVPDWRDGRPELPVATWRELLAIDLAPPPNSGQLALFAPPPNQGDPRVRAQRLIADLVRGAAGEPADARGLL
jgi:hypothetical protein